MSMLRFLALSFPFPALVLAATPAQAQMMCGQRAEIIQSIDQKYQERPSAFGLSGDKMMIELYTSEKGTWTMLMTRPGGVSCIMAVGQSWENLPVPAKMTGL
jgi:hypothetical protein